MIYTPIKRTAVGAASAIARLYEIAVDIFDDESPETVPRATTRINLNEAD